MHRDKDRPSTRRLEATEEMWDNAGHPGWDALEAELDAIPSPKMTGRVTFGRPRVSRWTLRLAKLTKKKEFMLQVIIHQHAGVGLDGWHSCGVGPVEEEAALAYCRQFFQKAGFEIKAVTIHTSGAGVGYALFDLTVTTS